MMKKRLALTAFLALVLATGEAAWAQKKQFARRESEAKAAKQDVLLIAGLQSTYDLPFEPCTPGATPCEECIRVAHHGLLLVP